MPISEAALLDALPEAIIWVTPVHNGGEAIEDFEIRYANALAHKVLGYTPGDLTGRWVRRDKIPNRQSAEGNFQHFLQVLNSGIPQEFSFYVPVSGRQYYTERRLYEGGVLSIIRDKRAQKQAEAREQQNAALLDGIVEHAPAGILVYEAVRNAEGQILDFHLVLSNQRVHELTGIPEAERNANSFKQLMQRYAAESYLQRYIDVVETGTPLSFEYYYAGASSWLLLSSVRLGDGFLLVLSDITQEKKIQEDLEQESRFSSRILDASLNGIYVLEAVTNGNGAIKDFRFVRANQQFARLTGMPVEKILGQSFLALFPHTVETGLFRQLCKVMESGEVFQHTFYYAPSFHKWYDYMAVRMSAGNIVVTFQDVTPQLEAQERMERQKSLLDSIMHFSPAGITVTEVIRDDSGAVVDGRKILSNEAAAQFTGIPNEINDTHTLRQIDPALVKSPLFQMAVETLSTGKPFFTQYYFEPTRRWLELSVSKMDADHLINVFMDVTQSKEAQLQQDRLIEELRRSNANLEEFTYASSHDLKEPIRKIHIFTDQLQRKLSGRVTGDEERIFERIQRSARRMQLLIDDLLNYSQVSLETSFSLTETVDLNQKVKLALQDLELLVEEKGAHIEVAPLPMVKGHRRQLQQLFSNLLSNALKYTWPGVRPEIAIECREVAGHEIGLPLPAEEADKQFYEIDVNDNGIGFSQEEADRIFHVFERLHKGDYEGTGIGLAIARKVVENHRGYIKAESLPGKGASFRVYLPKPELE